MSSNILDANNLVNLQIYSALQETGVNFRIPRQLQLTTTEEDASPFLEQTSAGKQPAVEPGNAHEEKELGSNTPSDKKKRRSNPHGL